MVRIDLTITHSEVLLICSHMQSQWFDLSQGHIIEILHCVNKKVWTLEYPGREPMWARYKLSNLCCQHTLTMWCYPVFSYFSPFFLFHLKLRKKKMKNWWKKHKKQKFNKVNVVHSTWKLVKMYNKSEIEKYVLNLPITLLQ